MIHTGSRGLGHQVCTDALVACDRWAGCERGGADCGAAPDCKLLVLHLSAVPPGCCTPPPYSALPPACRAMARAGVKLVDRQLACMPIASPEGAAYLSAMKAAANFAFGNRTVVMSCVRRAFQEVFGKPGGCVIDAAVAAVPATDCCQHCAAACAHAALCSVNSWPACATPPDVPLQPGSWECTWFTTSATTLQRRRSTKWMARGERVETGRRQQWFSGAAAVVAVKSDGLAGGRPASNRAAGQPHLCGAAAAGLSY